MLWKAWGKRKSQYSLVEILNIKLWEAGTTAKKKKNSRQHCWTELICPCQNRCLHQWIKLWFMAKEWMPLIHLFIPRTQTNSEWVWQTHCCQNEMLCPLSSVPGIFVRYFLPGSQSARCILLGGICLAQMLFGNSNSSWKCTAYPSCWHVPYQAGVVFY